MSMKASNSTDLIAYVVIDKDQMIWLHAFKKTTQKTPTLDLKIAERRMGEVL